MDARVLQPEDGAPLRSGAGRRRDSHTAAEGVPGEHPVLGAGVAVDGEDQSGYVSAYDPRTGQERWRWTNDLCMCSSLLATGGDLVFGGTPTGEFHAWDANSGDDVWKFQCGSGHSSPSSYSIDGRQHRRAERLGRLGRGVLPKMLGSSHGKRLFAFALPE